MRAMSNELVQTRSDSLVTVNASPSEIADSYHPVISEDELAEVKTKLNSLEEKFDFGELMSDGGGAIVILTPAMTGFLGAAVATCIPGADILLVGMLTAVGLPSVAGIVYGAGVQKRNQVKQKIAEIKRANQNNLQDWLHSRYNIDTLSSKLDEVNAFPKKMTVEDVNGRKFALKRTERGTYVLDEKKMLAATAVDQSNKLVETLNVFRNVGDRRTLSKAASVLDDIESKLTKLAGRRLSIESQHVVDRTKNDLAEITRLNSELIALGAPIKERASLVRSLNNLNDELAQVFIDEVASIERKIAAQDEYIGSRQKKNSSLNLK